MKNFLSIILCFCFVGSLFAEDYYAVDRQRWLEIAKQTEPQLVKTICKPVCLVKSVQDADAFQGWRMEKSEEMDALYGVSMKQKPECIVDFGRHMVGYYTFRLKTTYRVQDGPLRLRFTFAEVPAELNTPFDPYTGTLSRAWLQDEIVNVYAEMDTWITIPRRMTCRYVKIELLASSPDFDFCMEDMYFTTQSSAPTIDLPIAETTSEEIKNIYTVGLETLRECMQTVYEDGPKRDQRLWIGDVYLESLANTQTFKNHMLTKHCLYMLAALAADNGSLHANVFEHPDYHPQLGSHCLDYSLLYNATLLEYVRATNDMETARDLWKVAKAQMDDALLYVEDNGIFNRNKKGQWIWLFFDWKAELNPEVAIQGLMISSLKDTYSLAQIIGRATEVGHYPAMAKKMEAAARKHMFNKKQGLFVNPSDGQVSYLSQIYMIRAGVLNVKEGVKALKTVFATVDAVKCGTPYATHYLIDAMIKCGMEQEAKQYMIDYWGDMVRKGADTFWEVYDPADEYKSPYNFYPINSYCHAWSCTPIYFIRKYPKIFQQ